MAGSSFPTLLSFLAERCAASQGWNLRAQPSAACPRTAAFRASRPLARWPGQRFQPQRSCVSAAALRGPRQERDKPEAAPGCPPPRSRRQRLGDLAGGAAQLRGEPASVPCPSPSAPTTSRLTPPRALSTGRTATPPRSLRLHPAPPQAPLPRRGRRERAGDEGVNPGLFPARRDPKLIRAGC